LKKKLESLSRYYQGLSLNEIINKIIPEIELGGLVDFALIESISKRNLKLENLYFLYHCLILKHAVLDGKVTIESEQAQLRTLKILDGLLLHDALRDDKLDEARSRYSKEFESIFSIDFENFGNPYFSLIDEHLESIEQRISTISDYFIESIDKIALGNFFKGLLFEGILNLIPQACHCEIKNRNLVKDSLVNPNGITSAPLIAEQIAYYKQIAIPEHQLDFFDMNEIELIDLKNHIDKEVVDIDMYKEFSNRIKECFKFRSNNIKGLATILYDLYQIVSPQEFKSKEELEKVHENTTVTVDSKYWAKYKVRQVSKKIDFSIVYS
jgi:hypothetical protein